MEGEFPLLYHIALNIGLPVVTLFAGWFGQAWKSKAQKKADELDNSQQIITMQRDYIAEQQMQLAKYTRTNQRLEEKLDRTNEGDGCPVLTHEEKVDKDRCETCKYNQEDNDAEGQN